MVPAFQMMNDKDLNKLVIAQREAIDILEVALANALSALGAWKHPKEVLSGLLESYAEDPTLSFGALLDSPRPEKLIEEMKREYQREEFERSLPQKEDE